MHFYSYLKYFYFPILIFLLANIECWSKTYKSIILQNINDESIHIPIENHRIITFANNNIYLTKNINLDSESTHFNIEEFRKISFSEEEDLGLINTVYLEKRLDPNNIIFDPFLKQINLNISDPSKYTLHLYTINGISLYKSIFDENGFVNLPLLSNGIYIAMVSGENFTSTIKIIIE